MFPTFVQGIIEPLNWYLEIQITVALLMFGQ